MISLLHPSRGRPEKAFACFENWYSKTENCRCEYILSLDEDDPTKHRYIELFGNIEFGYIIESPNKSLVDATNNAAKIAHGDILLYLSDDFDCPKDWDIIIETAVKGKDKYLLKVNDCLQPFKNTVLTIPIMSRSLYEELGFFWYPEYKSQWVDVDLYYRCEKYLLFREDLKFRHNHYSALRIPPDETYRRSEGNWKQGLDLINEQLEKMGRKERFTKSGQFNTR